MGRAVALLALEGHGDTAGAALPLSHPENALGSALPRACASHRWVITKLPLASKRQRVPGSPAAVVGQQLSPAGTSGAALVPPWHLWNRPGTSCSSSWAALLWVGAWY